jgi:hypothetical protein
MISFKVEVLAFGEREYASNGQRFATADEAEDAGAELFSRWFGAAAYRVAESDDDVNYAFNPKTDSRPVPIKRD